MPSRKFLEQVADFYTDRHAARRLEDYVFVFPNRRSGRFLKRYMQQRIVGTSFMPRFITIGAFVARLAECPEIPHRDALFELYDAYRDTLASYGRPDEARDFDKFIFWGEMILSDFDEIDRNGVSARELYTNLSRLKEISADYLDDEQKAVVRELWGEHAVPDSVGSFWRHVGHDSHTDMAARFVSLWTLLGDMYEAFTARLRQRGLATAGMQHREALSRLRTSGRELIGPDKYAFIGFNDPGVVETLIFDYLKGINAADFFWDTASPFIRTAGGFIDRGNAAFRTLDSLSSRFPMPEGFNLDPITGMPDIDVIAVPSRTAQTKMAADILSGWIADGFIDTDDAIGTALILPDESLLMPLLHSLPEQLRSVNITMSVPFAGTAFAALLRSVVSMQMRARRIRGTWRFFHEDILEVVNHPHLRTAAGEQGAALKEYIKTNNLYTLEADHIGRIAPALAFIFRAVDDTRFIGGVRGYLTSLVEGLHAMLAAAAGNRAAWELGILEYLHREIDGLASLVEAHNVDAGEKSYFALFERALHSYPITMAGTPLKGLQIMSVAETRGIDFDNLIILSMNERVFPQRNSVKTMIPNALRAGYGLPPTDRDETDAAYYFYRLIARASRVALLYDARDASAGTGEASRFLTQLRYLHSSGNLRFRSVSVGANAPEKRVVSVAKTPSVRRLLERFLADGDRYISASALKTFKHCGLKFFLQYACGFRGEDEVTEYITSAVYGTILHEAAERIYNDYSQKPITAPILAGLAAHMKERYTPLIEQLINKHYYHREADSAAELPVEGQIVRDLIIDFLSSMFGHERAAWCPTADTSFRYVQGEMLVKGPWHISPSLSINFKMYIDRVDETAGGLRFIDYKTGGDETEAPSVAALFRADDSRFDAILQILAYCEAYASMQSTEIAIHPVLYTFRTMDARGGISPVRIGGHDVTDYHSVSEEFMPMLRQLVEQIFDPEKPFTQAEEGSVTCSYCVFAPMCGRVPRVDE